MNIVAHNKPGVYCITNTVNGKKYVGSSANVLKRLGHHCRVLRYKQHHNTHLQAAYNKYGEESFTGNALLYCNESDLLMHEQYYIDTLKPEYNKNPIAGRTAGVKRSLESRLKYSERMRNLSDVTKQRMSQAKKGKVASAEARQKMSLAQKGKKHNLSPQGRAVIIALNKARVFTSEILAKIGNASKNRSDESIEKNRQAHLGKKASEETKRKMSEAQKRRYQK